MEHLLFAGYLIVFTWLVTKVRFFTSSGLTNAQLIALFLFKVLAGIFYGWVGVYYGDLARMVDTWYYHYQSLSESRLMLAHPTEYVTGFFSSSDSSSYSGFLGAEGSWWNDLDINFMLKLLGMFNVASFGYYYINVIFYSFITLFGPVALYRVFNHYFSGKPVAVLLAVFFIPSFIYWTSGLHKEGLIFNGIALIIYQFYFGLKERTFGMRRITGIVFLLLLLVVLRNYIVLVLLPALLAWVLAERLKKIMPVLTYSLVYGFFVLLFFIMPYVSSSLDFPGAVVEKQRQFSELKGGSEVLVARLKPTAGSFLANAPQAINLSLLRPYFSDIRHLLSLAAAVEVAGLLLLFFFHLICNRKTLHQNPFSLFCLFFSFSVLFMIGYTVNFLGAIVRYRSIVLPLLFVPVVVQIPWNTLGQLILNIKNNKNFSNP